MACGGLCAMKMGKHNDTPALNASQHWAASQKVGRVRILWRPLNQWHSQILPLRREVVSNRRILMKQTRRQFSWRSPMRASDDERLPLCFFVYLMPIYSARAISVWGIKMKSKNIKRLENYPDILSLEDVRSILDVRTKKTAARWLQRERDFLLSCRTWVQNTKSTLGELFYGAVKYVISFSEQIGTLVITASEW